MLAGQSINATLSALIGDPAVNGFVAATTFTTVQLAACWARRRA
jgi:hypothetical protein